jgi:hypothetical protein
LLIFTGCQRQKTETNFEATALPEYKYAEPSNADNVILSGNDYPDYDVEFKADDETDYNSR